MPHQDALDGTSSAQHLQEAFEKLVPDSALEGIEFQEGSRWRPSTLVFAALMWSWSDKRGLVNRFQQAYKILFRLEGITSPPGKSYNGFLKRLRHWNGTLVERLKVAFRQRLQADLSEYVLIFGWLVLAGDGSRLETPRTPANQRRFAGPKPRKGRKSKGPTRKRQKQLQARRKRRHKQSQEERAKKADTPQMWITMLVVVAVGLPWDWRRGPGHSSEREHLLEMARGLPSQALLTLDAGFVGYDFWKTLVDDAKVRFVARVGGNVRLLKGLGQVQQRENRVYVWPEDACRKGLRPLALRLECFHDGKEPVYLVSNVLDEQQLSVEALKAVYKSRWGVEVYYRDFKQTFDRAKLRSKSPEAAELELDWSFLGLWAVNLLASLEKSAAGLAPHRRSVAQVLRAVRTTMNEYKSAPDAGEDLWTLLGKSVQDSYQRKSEKTNGSYPRKKQRAKTSSPQIILASAQQIQAASQHLKDGLPIGGLTA